MKRITIDPITRLEGHGKIEIFLDEEGNVANAYFQIPELRGFEQFCVGRPAEEMPRITNRICGVCPEAHHMAATKALDALYHIEPSSAVKKLRELFYMAFYVTDHTTHFYALGGPDFVVGPDAPKAERNILGVIHKVGVRPGRPVTVGGGVLHGRVADRAGERGAVGGHLVEERGVTAEALGDDPQEPPLDVLHLLVEVVEHLGDAGHSGLGQHLRAVAVRVAGAQRMALGQRDAPVEHLLPVGHVAAGGSFHEQAGVTGLAVALGGDERLLGLLRMFEELLEHPVGRVEHVLGQIVTGVDEPGGQAAAHTVDDGTALRRAALLEDQQVDFQDLVHGRHRSRVVRNLR